MITLPLCAALALLQDRPLPAEARAELRAVLTEALAEPDPRARARVVARAGDLADGVRFAHLVSAVREGPIYAPEPPAPVGEIAAYGTVLAGFAFEHDGATYRYAVDVPEDYDPARPHGLLLDPGHGSARDDDDLTRAEMIGMYRRHAGAAGLSDWLVARTEIVEQIGAGGTRGALPEDEVAEVFQAFFRHLVLRFHVDPDRVYATGVSQTGYWAWYLGRFRADRLAGICPMSAITRRPADAYLANFLNLPVFAIHGSGDTTCSVSEPRHTCARLAALGAPVEYLELHGAGHDYSTWQHQPQALEWLAERARDPYPRRVTKSLQTTRDGWCYWLRVDALEREGDGRDSTPPTGGIDAELEGQTVRLFSEGVERVTLALSSEMLDLERPVEVVWNGKRVHAGPVERDVAVLVGLAAEKADWRGTFEAALELKR